MPERPRTNHPFLTPPPPMIKPMLMRLQTALDYDNLSQHMLLLPGMQENSVQKKSQATINLVVAYNGSPNSQTALDFTLWIAHQTRLTTPKPVMVHVVYVVDHLSPTETLHTHRSPFHASSLTLLQPDSDHDAQGRGTATLARPLSTLPTLLDQADRVLWQARSLAEEWRGSLDVHLRFGAIATELNEVVEQLNAELLFVGCGNAEHPLVQQLTPRFPCPVLGIPTGLEGPAQN